MSMKRTNMHGPLFALCLLIPAGLIFVNDAADVFVSFDAWVDMMFNAALREMLWANWTLYGLLQWHRFSIKLTKDNTADHWRLIICQSDYYCRIQFQPPAYLRLIALFSFRILLRLLMRLLELLNHFVNYGHWSQTCNIGWFTNDYGKTCVLYALDKDCIDHTMMALPAHWTLLLLHQPPEGGKVNKPSPEKKICYERSMMYVHTDEYRVNRTNVYNSKIQLLWADLDRCRIPTLPIHHRRNHSQATSIIITL